MAYYYNVYKKSFSIIFKFNYLKIQREKKSFIKLIKYETKVIKMNNEINRKYSDIKKQCYCIENNLLPKEIYKLESKVWTVNLLVTIISEAI